MGGGAYRAGDLPSVLGEVRSVESYDDILALMKSGEAALAKK